MIIHIVRTLYLVVMLAFTVSYAFQDKVYLHGPTYVTLYILIPAIAAFAIVMVDMFWRKKRLQALSGLFFGLLAGLAIAYVLSLVVQLGGSVFIPEVGESGSLQAGKAPQTIVNNYYEVADPNALRQAPAPAAPTSAPALAARSDVEGPNPSPTTAPVRGSRRSAADAGEQPVVPVAAVSLLNLIKVLLGTSVVFMCVSFVLQTKDDFRFVIPYVEFSKQTKGARPLLLDTSVIIDGRVADIAETRILESELIVPRFILAELQAIADSDDKLKRNRGRRGLDILNRLQGSDKIDIRILDAHIAAVEDAPDADAKLVALARHLDGRVVTNDYNLNKVAQLRGVDVINVNDLANALKPIVLPGESMSVKIIKPGEEPGQGVGYLEDGTMVVAEQGRDYIGREIAITVTSVLQTSAGRMIFGRLDADKTFGHRDRRT